MTSTKWSMLWNVSMQFILDDFQWMNESMKSTIRRKDRMKQTIVKITVVFLIWSHPSAGLATRIRIPPKIMKNRNEKHILHIRIGLFADWICLHISLQNCSCRSFINIFVNFYSNLLGVNFYCIIILIPQDPCPCICFVEI